MFTGGQILNFKKSLKLEISSHSLTHSLTHLLPDHSHKPRAQKKQRMATILHHNNKLTSEMCLLGFQQVWGLCTLLFLYLPLGSLMQQNYINVLIFPINTFFE